MKKNTGGRSGVSRRRVLRQSTATVGLFGLAGVASVRAGADEDEDDGTEIEVSGGGAALQDAVDGASAGDEIAVVDSATYDPVTVDVRVTVEADEDATIEGDGGTGAAVRIAADGVTLEGFTVTNPGGLLGVKVEPGYDDVTVEDTTVENVGPTGRLGVTGIVVGQGDHDGIEIADNVVQNLDQETTDDSGFPTVNGILFDADNSDPGTISDTVVEDNTIRDVESDVAPLGIVVQHETDDVEITDNEIRRLEAADDTDSDQSDGVDFGFTFAQGINVASPSTTDTTVEGNVIDEITSAETILPEAVKIDGDGGGVTFRENELLVAVGLNNRNGTDGGSRDPSTDPEVDAEENWWGSEDGPEEAAFNRDADDDGRADVVGNVDVEPFLEEPPGDDD